MKIENRHYKDVNSLLYKFIWNRHYSASKAPERIKRCIVTTPVKFGGFGMLDVEELDSSLKLRAIGRLLATKHPFMTLLKAKVDLTSFFKPKINSNADPMISHALKLLESDRSKLWKEDILSGHKDFVATIREMNIRDLVSARGQASLPFYLAWRRGARKVKDLNLADIRALSRHLDPEKTDKIKLAINCVIPAPSPNFVESYFIRNKSKAIEKCTSKEFRTSRNLNPPITYFKLGLALIPSQSLNWGNSVSKLTSTKHKSILLRIAHGDIYTKDKLFRFNLIDSDKCPRCDEPETLEHKFLTCPYIHQIWHHLSAINRRILGDSVTPNDPKAKILGVFSNSNQCYLTIVSELLLRISYLRDDQNYLLHPKVFIENTIRYLHKKERSADLKDSLYSLLGENS